VDSSSGAAAQLKGASTVTAGAIGGPGGFVAIGGSSFTPTPVAVAAQADPYAASPEPPHSCSGGSSLLATSAKTASPGTYTSLGAMTGGSLTLLPGNYTITQQFTNMGNGVVTGTGVTLYFCPGAGIALTGSSSTTLSAPGGSSGFVIFFDRTNTAQITTVNVTTNITGVIYAKSGAVAVINLTVSGDVVADTFRIRSGGVVTITGGPPVPPTPNIFLGYADTFGPRLPGAYPSPWQGSAGVIFVGCGTSPVGGVAAPDTCPRETTGADEYDAGAIRIDNPSATASMPVTAGSVKIGSCTYNPWPGLSVTIPPGGSLILTQTGLTGDPCGQNLGGNYNFDTSESSGNGNCTPSGAIPVITLTINGSPTTINDTGQILNKKGIDTGACNTGVNESSAWVQVL
jgi:hypothetical protein